MEEGLHKESLSGNQSERRRRLNGIICITITVVLLLLFALIFIIAWTTYKVEEPIPTNPLIPLPPTGPPGADGPYKHAVVASDAGPCSEIGRDILKKNGSAMDASIAALFCIGVYNMHSAGIGGGGFLVVYNKSNGSVEVIDFREEAPGKANRSMYVGGTISSREGPTGSGVPGEVKGFYEGWKKYGKLSWKELVQPSIDMARKGFPFGYAAYKAAVRSSVKPLLKKDPGMRFGV